MAIVLVVFLDTVGPNQVRNLSILQQAGWNLQY